MARSDLAAAISWTEQALALVERRRPSSALYLKRGELEAPVGTLAA
ncbi:MAG: hypothetical protein R3C44_04875 [Chloroflexota bacterium]